MISPRENEFDWTNDIRNYNFTEHQMICFYRIIQELLFNAVKHSRASSVSLSFILTIPTLKLIHVHYNYFSLYLICLKTVGFISYK